MARYIVLEYQSNEEAEEAVQRLNEASKKGKRVRVVGMFAPPRIMACRCGAVDAKYRRKKAERGAKYGWWLCGECNKPRAGGHNLNNLIPPDKVMGPGPTGFDGVYMKHDGSHYEWVLSQLMIFEVPTDNIGRKKKWRLKR